MRKRKTSREWADLYLESVTHKIDPKAKILVKQDSKLMRFLASLKFWNKTFMIDEVTIIGSKIYIPRNLLDRIESRAVLKVMAHSTIILAQKKKLKALWYLLYGHPQWLSLFALGALVGGPWWLVWLLLFLLPWPSLFRYSLLLEQYRTWMIFEEFAYRPNKQINIGIRGAIAQELRSFSTYWCMPLTSRIHKDLTNYHYMSHPSPEHKMLIDFIHKHKLDQFGSFYLSIKR